MNKSEIKITVEADENHVPEKIQWEAENGNTKSECKAAMMSVWDKEKGQTLRVDLWTKDMYVDDMKILYYETLNLMADSFERATGEIKLAQDMREFTRYFGEELKLIDRK
jgi:gliding motility-associated protein GldC